VDGWAWTWGESCAGEACTRERETRQSARRSRETIIGSTSSSFRLKE